MASIILNHKMEIVVLQIFVFYIVWTTSAYAKTLSRPIIEPPSNIHHFGKNIMHYNGNPPNPSNYHKRSFNGRMQSSASSFHNDILLPPPHQFQPHNVPPPNVYTMDPILGAPNPSESHHELK